MSAKWGEPAPAIVNGNPYAEALEEYADPRNSLEAVATLALVFEQRTANLIALAELKRKDRTSGATAASTEVLMIIEERLGLT